MLKPPRLGGAEQLRLLVSEIGFERACRIVDVHASTMRRYLRDEPAPPQAVLQALYWLSRWGFEEACAEASWTHGRLLRQLQALDVRVPVRLIGQPAANEARFRGLALVPPAERA